MGVLFMAEVSDTSSIPVPVERLVEYLYPRRFRKGTLRIIAEAFRFPFFRFSSFARFNAMYGEDDHSGPSGSTLYIRRTSALYVFPQPSCSMYRVPPQAVIRPGRSKTAPKINQTAVTRTVAQHRPGSS